MRYISRPQKVEAVQWKGDNLEDIEEFGVTFRYSAEWDTALYIVAGKDGAQKYVPVPVGHYIVRSLGDYSHYWPVDPDYFSKKYISLEIEENRHLENLDKEKQESYIPCGVYRYSVLGHNSPDTKWGADNRCIAPRINKTSLCVTHERLLHQGVS